MRNTSIRKNLKSCLPLWPCVIGLSISRASIVISSYGSYTSTDAGIITDGSTLFNILIMGVALLIIVLRKTILSRVFVRRLSIVCIVVEALALLLMALFESLGLLNLFLRMTLSIFAMVGVAGAIYFWLRKARGSNTLTAAILVFSALFISEIVIFPFTAIPETIGFCIAGVFTLGQLLCMKWCEGRMRSFTIDAPAPLSDYFGYAKTLHSNVQFLILTAVGIGLLSIVSGLLRGFPDGQAIAFTPMTRVMYFLITLTMCALVIILVAYGSRQIMTTGIWTIMQISAYLALLLYVLFPDSLEYGAVFATVLNVAIMGLNWYITIAFMSYGWRDPLYYALGGRIVWFGGRSFGRIVLLQIFPLTSNVLLMVAVIAGMLLLSTQVTYLHFARIIRKDQELSDQHEEPTEKPSAMEKLMALDSSKSFTSLRQVAMEQSAKEMSKQFLLSERETEVLILYALGFTQKRVAEELFISPGTVRGHVKRIYLKTDLHSRQEILDYMEKYTS